jgi:hypothetical protein
MGSALARTQEGPLEILLVVLVVGVALLAFKLAHERKAAAERHAILTRTHEALERRVAELSRFQTVLDAEAYASELRGQAEREAAAVAARAREEADRLAAAARAAAASATAVAQATLGQATADAKRIVAEAERKAQELAGEALTAVQEAKRLERVAQAMRNVIEGYGNQYVIPSASFLDELAEQFGFAEAGQRLKAARGHVREMVSNETAATCDYVEANRRQTAIEFVVDAFNGKVDTILSGVRHDNAGTLQQKIKDAFVLVNNNGKAFRDARITPEYLAARQEELRWAVVAQELKLKEREEQREIKERIREEERAQREFEKAMRDAEKEEDVLRKAMEKAKREIDKASSEQKAKYELQLQALEEKLKLAEEKNRRALSMAQQTKSGHVYVISNEGSFGEQVYKIGMTRRLEPMDRVHELGDASVPFEFDVHAMIPSEDAPTLERALHKRFVRHQMNKVNPRKEFFRVPLQSVRQAVEEMGAQAAWTMAAQCREFTETKAIDLAIQAKTLDATAWSHRQNQQYDALETIEAAAEAG